MVNEYHNNHYVPVWYQKRFLPAGQKDQELFYLDLKPGAFTDPRGVSHPKTALRRLGFRHCFAERDLYTTRIRGIESTEIEQKFFGDIDRNGYGAVKHYENFSHPSDGTNMLQQMMLYMSTQKLRTPKGLAWLREQTKSGGRDDILRLMIQARQLHCAIWVECVWLLADASKSETKFIVSDHPVTVYNRGCGPKSEWCQGNNDPDIRFHATHTLFPLSLDKILILTNLSWIRNPYQAETGYRPNPNLFRNALFFVEGMQTLRHLNEQEVREINFIIKSRALRYIGAAEKAWLYPEEFVTALNWYHYGDGYLCMPDPRGVPYMGEIIMGFPGGRVIGFDEYGHHPGNPGFRGGPAPAREDWPTCQRFQGEFARLYGPNRRGRAHEFGRLEDERDTEDCHNYHLGLEKAFSKGPRNS